VLHAFVQSKSRLYRRYLGQREEPGERRIAAEDEITSIITGPLAYMPPAASGAFWVALANLRNPKLVLPPGAPTEVSMQFWDRNKGIEPDLRVDLGWGSERRIFLVEFKWRAPLSGADQLHDQWDHYLLPDERVRALHLFIGLDTSEGLHALSRGDVWEGKLLLRTWCDVLTTIKGLQTGQLPALHLWCAQVEQFLKLLGVHRFDGFGRMTTPDIPTYSPVFFRSCDD